MKIPRCVFECVPPFCVLPVLRLDCADHATIFLFLSAQLSVLANCPRCSMRHTFRASFHEKTTEFSLQQLERLLPDHACESGFLGETSRDALGLLKRGRDEATEDSQWYRHVKRECV